MTALALALLAAYGVYLLYTALVLGWRGFGLGPRPAPAVARRVRRRLHDATGEDGLAERAVLTGVFALGSAALGFALFGGLLPASVAAGLGATLPFTSARAQHERARHQAREAWPRLIEEMRLQVGPLGRSVPQALFDLGRRAPPALRPAFAAAEREWLVSADFTQSATVLRRLLSDATADAALETLLVAHEVGGAGLDRRLAALAEHRVQELQGRKDALTRQEGVRFARRFVLLVPLGMALAGLSIGTGRAAYATAGGQLAVALGVACVGACWAWAGRLLRLPEHGRVFRDDAVPAYARPEVTAS